MRYRIQSQMAMMAPPKSVGIIVMCLVASVRTQHQPYFFNYQPQQQQPFQHNFQPFTNPPPGNFYQPSYESQENRGNAAPVNNYFSSDPTPPANHLITYPTQVSTLSGPQSPGHLNPYQPVSNSLHQQQPTVSSNLGNTGFRPSPLINHNHHSHIVNGLPRQQFFGNNYDFFRQRHGLTNLPTTIGPFNTVSTPGAPAPTRSEPQPTPVVSKTPFPSPSPSAQTAQQSSKPAETKPSAVPQPSRGPPPTTHPTIVQHFPSFLSNNSPFSPDSNQMTKPLSTNSIQTKPVVANIEQSPTSASITSGVSPSFAYSQVYPQTDTGNELQRQPLYEEGAEDEAEEEDDSYSNRNNYYQQNNFQQQRPQSPSSIPVTSTAPIKAQHVFTSNSGNNNLNSNSKDEPAPIRIHNTQPIRIVFNYEQAAQALEENPGIRVVIARTDKNNLTREESTTIRPTTPFSITTPAPTQLFNNFPQTTYRPTQQISNAYATHRPIEASTPRAPIQETTPSRYEYQPVTIPYSRTTAATALEDLALELEGRFAGTGRPGLAPARPLLESTAFIATEPTPTENSLQTFNRGSKKFVVVPNKDNIYRAPEPRVVVNELGSIVVQTAPPSPSAFPTASTLPRNFPQYAQQPQQNVQNFYQQNAQNFHQQNDENLEQEIANLQELQREEEQQTVAPTTTTTTTTTTTPRPLPPRPRPTPRLRATTYRPATSFTTLHTRPPPPPPTPQSIVEEIPDNAIVSHDSDEPSSNQAPRYLYNNKQHNGLSGAHHRYEYNGIDSPQPQPAPQSPAVNKPRRKIRPRGRLVAGSPPRPVQVPPGQPGPLGPVLGPDGFGPPLHFNGLPLGPGGQGPLGPVPPGAAGPGPVFRVGPRGRLLRRKTRPRGQQGPDAVNRPGPPPSPSGAPSPLPDFDLGPQQFQSSIPSQLPPLYNPTPFIPDVPLVTTFRPGPPGPPPPGHPNLLIGQSISVQDENERRPGKVEEPQFQSSRFKFPAKPAVSAGRLTPSRPVESEDEEASNQFESDEETPSPTPPQRRRSQFSTTTSTEGPSPSASPVVADRANILQRQIRFNKNRQKNNQRN